MRTPAKVTAISVKQSDVSNLTKNDVWGPSRPEPYPTGFLQTLWVRITLAYGVLTGRFDALDWEESK